MASRGSSSFQWKVLDCSLGSIAYDDPSAIALYLAKHFKAAQNRRLPEVQWTGLDLVAGNELLDCLQQVKRNTLVTFEILQFLSARKNPRGEALLNNNRAAAILRFIDNGIAFALLLDQSSKSGRPVQDGGVGEMKYVVKRSISIEDIVGQRVTDEGSVPARITAPTVALVGVISNGWEAVLPQEPFIEVGRLASGENIRS